MNKIALVAYTLFLVLSLSCQQAATQQSIDCALSPTEGSSLWGNKEMKFLFLGESHLMVKENEKVFFEVFGNSNQFNKILLEVGFAEGYIMDSYLNEPEKLKEETMLTFRYGEKFVTRLNSLAVDNEISNVHVYGVNHEANYYYTARALEIYLETVDLMDFPDLETSIFRAIRAGGSSSESNHIKALHEISTVMDQENDFKERRSEYLTLSGIVNAYRPELREIKYSDHKPDSTRDSYRRQREKLMYEQTVLICEANVNQPGSYLGIFGLTHISKNLEVSWLRLTDWSSFAAQLNQSENFKGQVFTVPILYDYFSLGRNRFHKKYLYSNIGLTEPELKFLLANSRKKKNNWFRGNKTCCNLNFFGVVVVR